MIGEPSGVPLLQLEARCETRPPPHPFKAEQLETTQKPAKGKPKACQETTALCKLRWNHNPFTSCLVQCISWFMVQHGSRLLFHEYVQYLLKYMYHQRISCNPFLQINFQVKKCDLLK